MTTKRDHIASLIAKFSGQNNVIVIPRVYIDLCGDHVAALLLNQIVYWSDRTKDANGWFAKSYEDWRVEIGMSQYQVSRAVKVLKPLGVETQVRRSPYYQFAPTVHYRIDMSVLSKCIIEFLDNAKSEVPQQSEGEETSLSYSKTTPQTTAAEQERAQIFNLFESAFGRMVDNAMLVDELVDASNTYPAQWVEDAFKEAALAGAKNWKYVRAILERWQREGRNASAGRGGSDRHMVDGLTFVGGGE